MQSRTYTDFDHLDIEPPFFLTVAAPTGGGKTELLNKMIVNLWAGRFDNMIIASPTFEFKDEYPIEEKLSEKTKLVKIKTNLLMQIKQILSEQEEYQRKHSDDPENVPITETLLILDDCIDTDLFKGNRVGNVCDSLSTRGRHINMSVIVLSQKLSEISLTIRQNTKGLFILAPLHYADIERVLDEYVPQAFRKEFRQQQQEVFREPYAFILIDGSPERRTDFRLRIRKGFSDYMWDPTIPHEMVMRAYLKGGKKRKRKGKANEEEEEKPVKKSSLLKA